ncbi:hypothetical protein H8B06_05985 [Sphingobacterium sp. DN00404]|uniref:Cthe-2314-like HEPN domain-containing protein n=1 Tax=Sphingobacterium micropteri TaxID=2763501 RepID=A0ABR7YM20_9SPHI|nr:hypothetical protein [Sphingobacterium micropteri]MBD1432367.1 hypothetical protein [Sphingobacterium micropteri]
MMKFYNTNGIPTDTPGEDRFYIAELMNGELGFSTGDQSYEIEKICIQLRDYLAKKIFGDIQTYHSYFSTPIFPFASLAGIDAEIKLSKEDFEILINSIKDKERFFRLLYYFDVENLIGTLQNSVLETKYIIGNFYKTLNNNSFLVHKDLTVVDNGIQYASGYIVTNITSLVNHLFINLYSQMDFTTKIIYEMENLHTIFSTYPKLKSKDTTYGDSKKTALREMPGSIYEMSDTIRMIMYLRNEIVHNASIDSIPKVYQNIKNKKIIEKFILLPDFSNGKIKTYKNRKRFFNDDTKLNEILPTLISEFWDKLKFTLSEIK